MNTDHHHIPPPTQPPSSTTANNLLCFTNPLPHPPSPMSPTTITTTPPNSTPEQRLAAALGHAFFNISPSSFHPTITTTTADSSANQTTTTTPPKIPRTTPLRRTLSDSITSDFQQTHKPGSKNPLRRTLSDTTEYQQPLKTPRVSSSPQSSSGKQSPQSEIMLKKVEDMVREIEQRCWEIMREEEEEHVEEEVPQIPQIQSLGQEECVGVERMKNGDLRFELSCCCGKRFEMLIKHNGYCFYRLT